MSLHSVWNLYPEGQTRVLGKVVTKTPIRTTASAQTITRFTTVVGTLASWAIVAASGSGGNQNTGYVEIGATGPDTLLYPKIYLPANPTATPALTPSYFIIPIPAGSVIDLYDWCFLASANSEGVIVYYGL